MLNNAVKLFGMHASRPILFGALSLMIVGAMQPKEEYTTNSICQQNNCINPVFPGFQSLAELETSTWQCQSIASTQSYLRFCKDAVNYDVAIKSPNVSVPLADMVAEQEKHAVTMYVYHLAGMNMEALQYRHPEESGDECLKSVWMMVCNTAFPRAEAGCAEGQATQYMRPCKNVCSSYVKSCNVQCCDESVQCVFENKVSLAESVAVVKTGYVDALGPSAQCTGASARAIPGASLLMVLFVALMSLSSSTPRQSASAERKPGVCKCGSGARHHGGVVLAVVLVTVVAVSLQGCDAVGHSPAAWEAKPNYLVNYQFVPIKEKNNGGWQLPTKEAVLNSCQVRDLPVEQQCSGNGLCKLWNSSSTRKQLPLFFCECDRDWADPECRTRRKSQATAFLLSLFTGYLGLDHFYLGEYYSGFGKLATLGGLGTWWMYDIVRIGSAPIYADDFRLAADLPHWVYVMVSTAFFAVLGFFIFNILGGILSQQRRAAKALLLAEDDFYKSRGSNVNINPADKVGMPTKGSYGVPTPPGGYGTLNTHPIMHWESAPHRAIMSGLFNPLSSNSAYMSHAQEFTQRQTAYNEALNVGLRSHLQPEDVGFRFVEEGGAAATAGI